MDKVYRSYLIFLLLLTLDSTLGVAQCYNLRCSDITNPSGVNQNPYFGWLIDAEDSGVIQQSYQILVASSEAKLSEHNADYWNSGKVDSNKQNYIYYSGKPLQSGKRYYWTVRYWGNDHQPSAYANVNYFDVGLCDNADWSGAKWIRGAIDGPESYTYFRKQFELAGKNIRRALVYISAAHDFELTLNGVPIGKGPGYHYPQFQYYKTFDVTSQLGQGRQALAVLTHWYGAGQGRPKSAPGLLMKAVIEYEDGSIQSILTNETWKQTSAPKYLVGQPHRNAGEGVGFVEKIDARLEISNWEQTNFDDDNWESPIVIGAHPVAPWVGKLQPNLARLIETEIVPERIDSLGLGHYVIDLGKIYAGVPKITFNGGKEGNEVIIRGGYTRSPDGGVSLQTTQSTDMGYSFLLNGSTCTFQPMLYLGMRYLEVKGAPHPMNLENVRFIARHHEMDRKRSRFHSSNEMLNKVWELMKHSLVVAAQESFVDTPTREKGGFLGDSWLIGMAAMQEMGERVMNLRILLEFLNSQEQFWTDGRVNAVYPNGDGKRDIPDYTQMLPIWAWEYYTITGNKQFLVDHFPKIERVCTYVASHMDPQTGLVKELTGGNGAYLHGIIDWPATMRYGYDMATTHRTVINAYAYADFKAIAEIAKVTGDSIVANSYLLLAQQLKESINRHLLHNDGFYVDGLYSDQRLSTHSSQHANILPVALGIAPVDLRPLIGKKIEGQKMSVGMITVRWLIEAIGSLDLGEHLTDLYTRTDWDGWANTITQGATVTWESWDALQEGQSLSHPWGASGLVGIHRYVLGISILEPQFARVQIKPLDFGDKLSFVEGQLPTDRGTISIKWNRTSSSYSMDLSIPANMSADIWIPHVSDGDFDMKLNGKTVEPSQESGYLNLGSVGSGYYNIELTTH
ncbi:family 78 glycoside hydrolase catalytic domain [Marinoscillum furvescens]|nr:family 78 glycoside hydrolase catalytic domain [Marinoscillum furvescens]